MRISDWSSDVCSSDLLDLVGRLLDAPGAAAARSSADLGRIQARLRHDLRNPLNAIKGYAELLLEELDRSEERRVGKECVSRVDLGGRRIIKKKQQKL